MQIDIITAFPESYSFFDVSIVKRARQKNKVKINIHDLKQWGKGKWQKIDDKPFGGGAGMVIGVEPVYKALKALKVYPKKDNSTRVIITSAGGIKWNQNLAQEFSGNINRLVIICGHYEGIDSRVLNMVDSEISIGDFILSGGELASMVIVDSIVRLLDGVVGNSESIVDETSFDSGVTTKEYPQYTRPAEFVTDEGENWSVPEVLVNGDHKKIMEWKENSRKIVKN